MRIALLGSRGIPARHGGFETFAEGLAVRLVERGHVVTVYCEGLRRGRPRRLDGVHLIYVPIPARGCLRPLLYDLVCLIHASLAHDVVYLLGYGAALFGWIPRVFRRRLWINMDGLEWARAKWSPLARAWFRRMERLALRLADFVVFDAEAIRDHLVARHGPPRDGAVLAYAARTRLGAPERGVLESLDLDAGRYHLVVCRLVPENHVLEIVSGYARSTATAPLVLVTDSEGGDAYAQRCRAAGDERVRWVGTVWDRRKLESLRAGAMTYVHGHSVGGTNPSLLEAMACGNACIAHDNPFNREVLAESGVYFGSAEELCSALETAEAEGPAVRAGRGNAARRRVAGRYSWEGLAEAYDAALRQHVGEPMTEPASALRGPGAAAPGREPTGSEGERASRPSRKDAA